MSYIYLQSKSVGSAKGTDPSKFVNVSHDPVDIPDELKTVRPIITNDDAIALEERSEDNYRYTLILMMLLLIITIIVATLQLSYNAAEIVPKKSGGIEEDEQPVKKNYYEHNVNDILSMLDNIQ